jgi:threonine synthase
MITPNEQYTKLAQALGYDDLYFKREDLHPYGSHKGRSIPVMIDHYYERGVRHFAISSSGNAALAAAIHIGKLPDATLDIFVGTKIDDAKFEKLVKTLGGKDSIKNTTDQKIADNQWSSKDDRVKIFLKGRPLQALLEATKAGAQSLRQSDDDVALVGYEDLAKEIATIPNAGAVFMGTSSGTTAQALATYFSNKGLPIQVHIVQTSFCHPISDEFTKRDGNVGSIADAIVDKVALRKSSLIPLMHKTGGSGWCADDEDIISAQKLAKEYTGLEISTNSALSVAGTILAKKAGHKISGAVVCVIGGK